MSTEPDATKLCPYCAETILAAAIKCKHCGEFLDESPRPIISEEIESSPSVVVKRQREGCFLQTLNIGCFIILILIIIFIIIIFASV